MEMATLVVAAGRDTAWERWHEYWPNILSYAQESQVVEPGHTKVSHLSPAIRHRLLLEHELVAHLLSRYSFSEAEPFLERLARRLYQKTWLQADPSSWTNWRSECAQLRSQLTPHQQERLQALQSAQSGCAVIDYFVRELIELGYLHDKARRWLASWWTHVENLPWQLGAELFYRHLLDADAACNLYGWHEVLGMTGANRPQVISRDEIERSCASAMLEGGRGLDRLNDLSSAPAVQSAALSSNSSSDKPDGEAIVEMPDARWGLWLHLDDLCVEQSELAQLKIVAIAAFLPNNIIDNIHYGVPRRAFAAMALEDGLERAGLHYECEVEGGEVPNLADSMIRWVQQHRLTSVVTLAPFVGEWADAMTEVKTRLESMGIGWQVCHRREDLRYRSWPRQSFDAFFGAFRQSLNHSTRQG